MQDRPPAPVRRQYTPTPFPAPSFASLQHRSLPFFAHFVFDPLVPCVQYTTPDAQKKRHASPVMHGDFLTPPFPPSVLFFLCPVTTALFHRLQPAPTRFPQVHRMANAQRHIRAQYPSVPLLRRRSFPFCGSDTTWAQPMSHTMPNAQTETKMHLHSQTPNQSPAPCPVA